MITVADFIAARNCKNCAHFDGDAFCTQPDGDKVAHGYIEFPECLVCMDWTERDVERPESEAGTVETGEGAAQATEGEGS